MDRSDLINDAERRLWDAFPRGGAVVLGAGEAVRGEVIARLALGACPTEPGYSARLVVDGARITGRLDLSGAQLAHDLRIRRCRFDDRLDLTGTVTRNVELFSCHLPGIDARGWQAQGQVSFQGSRFDGQVDLLGARLGGEVSFRDCKLSAGSTGSTGSSGSAGSTGGSSTGSTGSTGSAGSSGSTGIALLADSAVVDGSMYLDHGFEANGKVRLAGARIGGMLTFDGARLSNAGDDAMTLDNARIGQNCFCRDGFTATGQIRMLGTYVEGQLSFNHATLSHPNGNVLFADNLTVTQSMFLRGAKCEGLLRLRGAHVHGQLNLDNAKLINSEGMAVSAEHLIVGRDMLCRWEFEARGRIQMNDARVGGRLSFSQGALVSSDGRAADLTRLEAGALHLDCRIDGAVDLEQARIGLLHIPELDNQPPVRLSGLTYADLDPDPDPPVARRIAWLRRDPKGFHPQPYEQLAGYYRLIGHDREARLVLLAKRRSRRALFPWWLRLPGWLLDGLAGYGYVPLRAFCWLLFAVGAGALTFYGVPGLPSPTGDRFVNALLLAFDTIVPASPFGLRTGVQLTGAAFGVAIGLQILGYALVLAVVPAMSRALSRYDK